MARISQKNLQKYLNRIEYAEQKRDANWRDRWLAWYKRYRNVVDKIVDPVTRKVRTDRSNISIPYGFTMVETILPRLVETLFAGRPYVSMKGLPPGRSGAQPGELYEWLKGAEKPWESAAKKMETLVDYQMNVPMDIQDIFAAGLKTMAIYGTTVAYTGWRFRERTVIRKELAPVMEEDPETGEKVPLLNDDDTPIMDYQEKEVSVKEYDDPEVEFLDLGLFYVDPNAADIDDARYCGHSCYLSRAQLEELEEQEVIKVDWKKLAKDGPRINQARNYRMTSIGLATATDAESSGSEDDLYELLYYWEDDLRVMIVNRCQIVAEGPNPYWHKRKPYDKDVYTEVPGEFYGIGIFEIVEDMLDELNVERNQRIDYRSHSMRRMFKIRKGSNIDRRQLVWKQNGIVEVDNMNTDLEVLEAPDGALAGSFNQEGIIKQDIRDTVGAHEIVMGVGSGGTATETMAKDNNASIRFKMIISSVEKKLLLGITRKMVQMNQQFIDDIRLLPLFDRDEADWPIITPEEIQGEFHLIPAGSSVEPMANKEAYKQRMVELYGMFKGDPFYAEFPTKRRNLMKKVLESFDITDTDDLLPTDDELAGVIKAQVIQEFLSTLPPQAAQLLAAFMQQGGGQPPGAALPSGAPPGDMSMPAGGAVNTAAMQEQGMQMAGAGV
ncbi:portal protein [Cohnella xylanilytica]|uniref:portal protein n=1 Tax=Cohnella xylanilytica TaxID=557555 RepID=UPI001BB3CB81|nr:hypothetical protein [Cohnella xylanilytica]